MGSITVRFFDKGSQPKSVELPSTKKYIREAMHGNSFDENDFDIYHVNVMGAEFDSLVDDKDMKGFNLLAEKMQLLKNEELDKFRAVLFSKNMFITEKLKTVDAIELCKILDNIDCYKLHTNKQNLTDEQLLNCEKVEYLGFLEKVGEYKNIDNSELYRKYEIAEDKPVMTISIREVIDVDDYGSEYLLNFPLRDVVEKDFEIVNNLDENRQFKISNTYYNKLNVNLDCLANKKELLELNEFAKEFIKLDKDIQNKFNAIHDMYLYVCKEGYENSVPISKLNQGLNDVDKFEFFTLDEMKELIVNVYLTEKGIDREVRKYIDFDKFFDEVISETDFYIDNVHEQKFSADFVYKSFYTEYLKKEHDTLIAEAKVIQENDFEMDIDM